MLLGISMILIILLSVGWIVGLVISIIKAVDVNSKAKEGSLKIKDIKTSIFLSGMFMGIWGLIPLSSLKAKISSDKEAVGVANRSFIFGILSIFVISVVSTIFIVVMLVLGARQTYEDLSTEVNRRAQDGVIKQESNDYFKQEVNHNPKTAPEGTVKTTAEDGSFSVYAPCQLSGDVSVEDEKYSAYCLSTVDNRTRVYVVAKGEVPNNLSIHDNDFQSILNQLVSQSGFTMSDFKKTKLNNYGAITDSVSQSDTQMKLVAAIVPKADGKKADFYVFIVGGEETPSDTELMDFAETFQALN